MIDVGKRIKQLREDLNISARELAKQTMLDPSQISKIESGASKPSLDALDRICKSLNISIAEFFSIDNNDINPDLRKLLNTTKYLSAEQLKLLNDFLETFTPDQN